MIDLTDSFSFFEGVKISPENNICWESIPKNNGCWIKGLLISCFGVDLPKRERVHVACVSLWFLKIWGTLYINCYIAMYDFV